MLEQHGSLGFSVLAARDALSVYVHPSNQVPSLSLDQLRGIFTGRIRLWSQLDGERRGHYEILVVNRSPASGSGLFFREHVLQGEPYTRRLPERRRASSTGCSATPASGSSPRSVTCRFGTPSGGFASSPSTVPAWLDAGRKPVVLCQRQCGEGIRKRTWNAPSPTPRRATGRSFRQRPAIVGV